MIDNNYDIIYLDYNDGTDDIERNAALLEEVIQKVDSLKALSGSTEKNVVMGISMGGLVARWALTDMEKKSENHDTRLFISYDAPMLGANVPLGFQALDAHLASTQIKLGLFFGQIGYITTVGSLAKPLQIYETPAAQQLLHYYVEANPLSGSLQMDNTVHNTFMNALYNLNTATHGYPTQCRNVAVSDGAECATELSTIQPGAQLLRLSGHYNTRFLSDLLLFALGQVPYFDYIFTLTNYPQFILTTVPGRTDLKCNFTINATPASGSIQVYNGRIYLQKKILWLIPVNVTLTSNSFNSPSGVLPLDNYPGGQYALNQVAGEVKDIFAGGSFNSGVLNALFKRGLDDFYEASPTFTFVTKASALDIGEGQVSLTEPDYLMRYEADTPPSPPKSTPFTNFITAMNSDKINENHTQIDERFGNWMATELNQNPETVDCSILCSHNLEISGPNTICTSATYSIPGLPANATVTWSIPGSAGSTLELTPDSDNTLTITNQQWYQVSTVLSAVINSGACDLPETLSMPINGTYPNLSGLINQPPCYNGEYLDNQQLLTGTANFVYDYCPTQVDLSSDENNNPIQLSLRSGAPSTWYTIGNTLYFTLNGGPVSFYISTGGGCIQQTSLLFMPRSDSYVPPNYKIIPNPANDEITIVLNNDDNSMESLKFKGSQVVAPSVEKVTSIKEVKMYDAAGKLYTAKEFAANSDEVQMDVSKLPAGIYFVMISDGKHQETQKLVINR